MTDAYATFLGSIAFAYLGAIQLLNSAAPRFPLSLARLIHWIRAMSLEFFAILGVLLFRFMPRRRALLGRERPILLVHGYVNNGSVWRWQKRQLEAAGFGPIYT